jgi:hypothetical protein
MPGTLTKADIIAAIKTGNGYSHKKSIDLVETLLENNQAYLGLRCGCPGIGVW